MDELLNTVDSIENEVTEPTIAEDPKTEMEAIAEDSLEVEENKISEPAHIVTEVDFEGLSKVEILDKIRFYVHDSEQEDCKNEINILHNLYNEKQKEEFECIKRELREKSAVEGIEIEMPKDPDADYLKELLDDYKKKRNEQIRKQEEIKEKNLETKREIIEKIKLLGNSESVNQSHTEFKALQKEWMEVGPVPAAENKSLWENYQLQVNNYYNLLKINRELRELDYKKNLEQKIALCEKMEELLLETDVVVAFRKSSDYFKEWKEIGPVQNDKREEIWDRFNEVRTKIYTNFQDHNEKQKAEREANYEQKIILCGKVEDIIAEENIPKSGKDWVAASKAVLEMQALWKTIGMVPTAVNNEIYERFRSACNKFFELKKDFFDKISNDLDENLKKKTDLCVTAESLQSSTDWKKTTEMFYDLQKKWKEIGPAPKKYSDQVWGRFRAACNNFFEAKNLYYSNIEAEHQFNLEKKQSLIEEIKLYVPVENQVENIEKIKAFKTSWNEIGYVATADKERLYNEFKDAINKIFEKINLNKNDLELNSFNTQVELLKESGEISSLQKERSNIVRKIQDLNAEVAQIENNIGFFSSGSESIINEFNRKIEKIKNEISVLKNKKKSIDLAERDLKNQD